jgi:hypothetical protein
MKDADLIKIEVQKEKPIVISDDILMNYLNPDQLRKLNNSGKGI